MEQHNIQVGTSTRKVLGIPKVALGFLVLTSVTRPEQKHCT